jgi:hypothetical protein
VNKSDSTTPGFSVDHQPLRVQALGVGGILDHALVLWKQNAGVLLVTAICIIGPLDYAGEMLAQWVHDLVFVRWAGTPPEIRSFFSSAAMYAVYIVRSATIYTLYEATCNHYLGVRYMAGRHGGASTSFRYSFWKMWRLSGRLIPIHLIFYVVHYALSMMCIVPGQAFYALLILRVPVMALEEQGPIRGFKRAVALIRGQYLVSFALIVVLFSVSIATQSLSSILTVPYLGAAFGYALSRIPVTLEVVITTVFFFSARSRMEHIDLDLLAREVNSGEVNDGPML